MPDTPTFPLLPADLKHLRKWERYRHYVPPPAAPGPYEQSSEASAAASRTLREYMRPVRQAVVTRPASPVPVRAKAGPSLLDRSPAVAVGQASLWAASVALPFELAYLLTCRCDLRGRAARCVLINPTDVRRALVVSRSVLAALRVLAKTFARRTVWDAGWFA